MRLTRVYFDVSMVYGFDGLRAVAKKAQDKLGPETTVLFINKAMTSFKMVVDDTYLVYYRNGHRRIPLESLKHLPKMFKGTKVEMDEAIRKSLFENLKFK